ncbi:MAG TPA: hypothetical protein VD865_03235 [Stenotrophomonas sp.]|nr:hypothetical protein [Stenotrophomonas sp.]
MVKKTSQEAGIEAAPRPFKDIIDRRLVRDARLSFRALGVAVRLLSNAAGFRMTSLDLAWERPEGRDAVRTALNELEVAGYLKRHVSQLENGQWVTRQVITDVPPPKPENQSSAPTPEKPDVGEPGYGRRGSKSSKSTRREISKSKHTTTATSHELVWPASLGERQVVVVQMVINGLDQHDQQQLLDELAGAMRGASPPRKLASWMRSLRASLENGEFTPDAGLPVVQERERRSAENAARQKRAEERQREEQRRNDPTAKARSQAAQEEAMRKIGSIFRPDKENE